MKRTIDKLTLGPRSFKNFSEIVRRSFVGHSGHRLDRPLTIPRREIQSTHLESVRGSRTGVRSNELFRRSRTPRASSARRNSIRRSRLTPHTSDRPVQKRPIQKRPCAHRYDECAPPEALPRSSPTDSPVPAALGARRHGQRSENSDQPSSPIVRRMSTIRRWKWRMLWMLRRVGPSISSAMKRCRR